VNGARQRVEEARSRALEEIGKRGLADPNLRALAAQIPDNIMLLDEEERIRFINWTVPDVDPERVLGTQPYDYIPEQQRERTRAAYRHVLTTGEHRRIETIYEADDGTTSVWETRITPLRRDDAIEGVIVVSTNVTERDEAAADRDLLFEMSLDLLCVLDPHGAFKRVNPAFSHTLHWGEEALLGKPLASFVHPADREATEAEIARLETGAPMLDFENRFRHADGSYRVLHWHAAPTPHRRTIFASARDVTEKRAMETRLRRTQKLEAVGHLAGGLAHDFNNHLLAILMNTDYALKHVSAETARDHLSEVKRGAQRAAELTRRLLDFSRKEPLQVAALDMNELIDDLLRMLRRTIPANIDLQVVAGRDLPTVAGDMGQLEQVVMNLCLNARDALAEGGHILIKTSTVKVNGRLRSARPWAQPGRYVLLEVTDDGIGMTADVCDRIFDPFFTTKPAGSGTGLGLATTYAIVEQHGGMIHVTSEPGRGTTFEVYLPVAEELGSEDSSVDEQPEPRGGTETILVAEDADAVRSVVTRALRHAGYRVIAASDGDEAVALVERHAGSIALALVDLVMPKLSGMDVALAIRDKQPDLKILFTSGYNDKTALRERLGQVQVVRKPYDLDELLHQIRTIIDD
jgi:PAS domain S-box-containing protein